MRRNTYDIPFSKFINKALLSCALCAAVILISCGDDKPKDSADNSQENDKSEVVVRRSHDAINERFENNSLLAEIKCDNEMHTFNVPLVSGKPADSIKALLSKDFIAITYPRNASLKDVFSHFENKMEDDLCDDQDNGISHIYLDNYTDHPDFVSYSLLYIEDGMYKRLIKTYSKPEMNEIDLRDITPEEKQMDVKRIFEINMRQSAINYTKIIPQERHLDYANYFTERPIIMRNIETEDIPMGIKKGTDGIWYVQTYLKVALPEDLPNLNPYVLAEVRLDEMTHYMNLEFLGLE